VIYEYRGEKIKLIKNSKLRSLAYILAVWILPCGMVLPLPAFAMLQAPVCTATAAHHKADLAMNKPAHTRSGSWNAEFILSEQENPGTDAPAVTQIERPQTIAASGSPAFPRAAVSVQVRALYSPSSAEPRFLRYGRLLI
jgi:hypothetical protein